MQILEHIVSFLAASAGSQAQKTYYLQVGQINKILPRVGMGPMRGVLFCKRGSTLASNFPAQQLRAAKKPARALTRRGTRGHFLSRGLRGAFQIRRLPTPLPAIWRSLSVTRLWILLLPFIAHDDADSFRQNIILAFSVCRVKRFCRRVTEIKAPHSFVQGNAVAWKNLRFSLYKEGKIRYNIIIFW
ncbi:MAG: hypothetical protein LUG87_04240, partial [Oscillospiraceae bacterium]|nr:hypothetical protein [Oscillospiraceae bacterium]